MAKKAVTVAYCHCNSSHCNCNLYPVSTVLTFLRGESLAVHLVEVVERVAGELEEAGLVLGRGLREVAPVPRDLSASLAHVGVHVVALFRGLRGLKWLKE